jgi:ribosomal protein S18 acetylase RimI-like enzyme
VVTPADASVRVAAPGDVPAIAAVHSRAWRAAYRNLLAPAAVSALTPEALTPGWQAAVTGPPSPRHVVFVARADDLVVGFAAVAPGTDGDAADDDGELVMLAVDPAHQRVGHGSRLLAAATDHLRSAGLRTVAAWTPEADEPRRAFLAGAGFEPDGAHRTYAQGGASPEFAEIRYRAALADDAAGHDERRSG